ncbi:MAG TPA: endonuclease MutS2 [Candidatus Binatia bacterium]|jgi:DNA mismatch repair protein MutS2|nr:endonuclease MutS2 [Candidatus Binatia bacterium]
MRERDLQALEFDKVLQLLAGCTLSSAGREACLALRPQIAREQVEAESERTWQFFRLLEEQLTLPLRQFPDIRPSLQWAAHAGAALEGLKLLEIQDVAALSRALSIFFRRQAAGYDHLKDLPERLLSFPELEDALRRCLDESGRLKDEASPELRALRRRLRALGEEIEHRLQELLRSSRARDVVADHYITIRNNRFVIPVRANFHMRLPGIVQDRSGSGETLFIEPLFAVELNNRLLLARKEEEAEEHRLFLWLTDQVRAELPRLESAAAALTAVDVLYAKVELARKQRCTKPRLGENTVRLRHACHPLLLATGKPVVPIDLLIPESKSGLIITGPNTGGKTAALKTLGLLCLMAQSGLLVPAEEESCLPIFAGIFADIGDAQSLEQSLSTFSAHVRNVAEILRELTAPALVLFDEPGGGTDPLEGGALACGLLVYLKERGVRVAASTHLTPVKLFALADGDYQVAAVDFDLDTLTPHYRLHYGTVGQSLGLPMARRLGLPEEVCAAAEATLSGEARQLSHVIAQLEESQTALERERALVANEREQIAALRVQQQALLAEAEERRRHLWQEELAEARHLIRRVREEGREIVARLRAARPRARQELTRFLREQQEAITAKERELRPPLTENVAPPQVGDEVEVRDGKIRGELVALQGDRARIRRGGLTFEVAATHIRKAAARKREPQVRVAVQSSAPGMPEINLLGMRVHEALPRLETFLDRAVLNHQPSVRIVHGMGTGALKRAVREYLANSPYCASYNEAPRVEGGGGVTIAELTL